VVVSCSLQLYTFKFIKLLVLQGWLRLSTAVWPKVLAADFFFCSTPCEITNVLFADLLKLLLEEWTRGHDLLAPPVSCEKRDYIASAFVIMNLPQAGLGLSTRRSRRQNPSALKKFSSSVAFGVG